MASQLPDSFCANIEFFSIISPSACREGISAKTVIIQTSFQEKSKKLIFGIIELNLEGKETSVRRLCTYKKNLFLDDVISRQERERVLHEGTHLTLDLTCKSPKERNLIFLDLPDGNKILKFKNISSRRRIDRRDSFVIIIVVILMFNKVFPTLQSAGRRRRRKILENL